MKKTLLKFFCVLLIAISMPLTALYAQIIYVSPGGNDSNNGSSGSPKATIGAAIAIAANGNTIEVAAGTYTVTTSVVIDKEVHILSNGSVTIQGDGNVATKALFVVNSPNVTIEGLTFEIAQTGDSMIGIATTNSDNFNNLTITGNVFKGIAPQNVDPTQRYTWDSYALKLGRGFTAVNNLITVVKNIITYDDLLAPQLFGRGIYAFNTYGKIGGSNADKNTIAAVYALQGGELGGGIGKDFEFSHNDVPAGRVSVVGAEIGNHKLNNNNIGYGIPTLAQANALVRFLEVKGTRTINANIEVSGNTITKYASIGIFIQRSNNVTINNNTLTPFQDAANTSFASIAFSSKEGTFDAQSAVTSENITITGNTFASKGSGAGGKGIVFYNHNASGSVQPLINAKVGGTGADKNTFHADLAQYIELDATPGGDTENPFYDTLYDIVQNGTNKTNILPFNSDIDAAFNIFGSIDSEMAGEGDLATVKTKITDKAFNAALGLVNIVPVILPVTLLDFAAQLTTNGALVKWSTAKEENNEKFEIEKSLDGKNFFVVESRKGQGSSTTTSSYEFLDVNFKQSTYYRLAQVDVSGKRKVYDDLTKFVKGLDNDLSVTAYPNPVTTKLYITVGAANKENVKVLLSDLTGKTLKVKTADSSQAIELDVAGIATGSYILQVIKDSGNVSKKILKL